jgi:phage terminase large subunit-like protein
MSNMVVVRDPANNMKANKARSYGRIDGGIALALAAHVRADFGLLSSDPAFDVAAIVG